jgi:hypothetical protein
LYELNDFRIDCVKCEIPSIPRVLEGYGGRLLQSTRFLNCLSTTCTYGSVGSNPVFAPPTPFPANYEADLRRFINCTNHKYALHSIRTLSFAYYEKDLYVANKSSEIHEPLPNCAALLLTLQLLSKRPFYSLRINSDLSREQDHLKLGRVLYYLNSRICGMFELETGGKRFSKIMVEDLARSVLETCRDFRIGER